MNKVATALVVAIIGVSVAVPLVTQAQTTPPATPSIQSLTALLTQLVQLLEQELAQITSSSSNTNTSSTAPASQTTGGGGATTTNPNGLPFQPWVKQSSPPMPCIFTPVSGTVSGGSGTSNCGTTTTTSTPTFTASPTSGQAPLTVNFSASPGATYIITYGDGASGTMYPAPTCASCQTVSTAGHTYQSAGTYTATLANVSGTVLGTVTIYVVSAAS